MRTHRTIRILGALALACVFAAVSLAQQPAKGKSHMLQGKVESVSADRLTVNHGKIEGYMDAMTMPYKVDKPDILKKVKSGDQIKATVYDGDFTLYEIEVLPPQPKSKK